MDNTSFQDHHRTDFVQGQLFDEIDQTSGGFARWLLSALVAERIPFGDAITNVQSVLARRPGMKATRKKRQQIVAHFRVFAASAGVEYLDQLQSVHLQDFYWSAVRRSGNEMHPPAISTASNRQSFMRAAIDVLVEMGLTDNADIVGTSIKRDVGQRTRPATNEELDLIRAFAEPGLGFSYRSTIVALRLAGGSAADLAVVRAEDVDLTQTNVAFADRTNSLDPWSVKQLTAIVAETAPDSLLCAPRATSVENAAHVITVQTGKVLADAGLNHTPGLAARSVELGAAKLRFDDDVIAAARFLGNKSLDATAAALAIDWQR